MPDHSRRARSSIVARNRHHFWRTTFSALAHLLVLGFELADHSLGLVVEGGDDLVGILFRVVKSQEADREIDDFMAVPRSRRG